MGGAEVCGGAADGVGVYDSPWRVGHPVAGGTGCKGSELEVACWA